MATQRAVPRPTGVERTFGSEEIIVSKTDRKGVIRYANEVFLRVSRYSEQETLGRPHNLVRHPDMPRAVFRLLWNEIEAGREIFAYVLNLSADGAHYWVLAHVTPSFAPGGGIIGHHSNRRAAARGAVQQVQEVYARLREEEQRHANAHQAAGAGHDLLQDMLADRGLTYSQFVWSLIGEAA